MTFHCTISPHHSEYKNEKIFHFQVHMTLNVTRVTPNDFGRYHCVAKNELGITKGDFTTYGTYLLS